jgi:DnaK suppressor protein
MSATTPSREELRSYRQRLQSLADRVSGDVTRLTAEATRPTGAEGTEAEGPAQEPAVTSSEGDEEVARSILMSEEQLLAEVREALARFDAGTFGRCERCGRSIGKTRLNAVPYARRCIRCANTENGDPA